MSKKSIALLLSGETRKYKDNYKSILDSINNIDCYNIDVFIHTWEEIGAPIWKGKKYNFNHIDLESIKLEYNPTIINVESKQDWHNGEDNLNQIAYYQDSKPNLNYLYMFYGWLKVFLLFKKYTKKNNKKYDFIIRTRPDLKILNGKIDFNNLDPNILYCGRGYSPDNKNPITAWKTIGNKERSIEQFKNLPNFNLTIDKIKNFNLGDLSKEIDISILNQPSPDYEKNISGICDQIHISGYNQIQKLSNIFMFYISFLNHSYFNLPSFPKVNMINFYGWVYNIEYKELGNLNYTLIR